MIHGITLVASFALAALLTPLVRKMAISFQVVDRPGPRKIHSTPTPLLGGLAVYGSFTLTVIGLWFFGYVKDGRISLSSIYVLLVSGAVLMIGGYLDDRYQLKPVQQFIFPLLAVIFVIASGIRVQFVTNPLGGILHIPALLGLVVAFLWLLGMSYTTKFLDGLDGLTSGITAIGSIAIFFVSLLWDVPGSATSYLALALAGSCLGFLVFNWHPAKIFLGEGGSVFCGFVLGVLSIISGSKIATALLVMGIPILDVAWVIIRRMWQGSSPTVADRKHLHFRLFDAGLSHRQVVILLYLLTASFGSVSLLLSSGGKVMALAAMVGVMIVLAGIVVVLYKKRSPQ